MLVVPSDNFNKSVSKIKDKIALNRLKVLVNKLEQAHNLKEISNVKSVVNSPNIYRIRTGDYRLFVLYRDGEITILLLTYKKKNEKTYNEF